MRAPFTFPEFLGHSFHFLSSVLPPFRLAEARRRPFSLSFHPFSLFFSLTRALFTFLCLSSASFFFFLLSSHLVSTVTQRWSWFNVTCNGTQRGPTSLFFLNAPVEIKCVACVARWSCPRHHHNHTVQVYTRVSDLHPKEQSEKITCVQPRFGAVQSGTQWGTGCRIDPMLLPLLLVPYISSLTGTLPM